MSTKTVVLTDVANGVWLDEYRLVQDAEVQLPGSTDWSISKRTLRGGVSEGVDVVEVDNGSFRVSVLPTRGMGLWRGEYRGFPLSWKSPVSMPVNPRWVNITERNGLGWLAGFNEWLCRCGLTSHGAPGTDVVRDNQGNATKIQLTLHGKIANTPAHRVEIGVSDEGEGLLWVTGVVDETMLFGPCLRLTSRLETRVGSNRLRIIDEVTNLSGQPGEVELLYHTNFGPPLLEQGARFVAPLEEVAPRDPRAAEGIDNWQEYDKPTPGYVEQCYFLAPAADKTGRTLVLLRNSAGDRGVSLQFNRRQLPHFCVWKNTVAEADGYVTGLEPATSFPNLKTFEREQGRVLNLAAGESYRTQVEIAVHTSKGDVSAVEEEIAGIQGDVPPRVHRQPQAKYSPAG